MEYLSIGIDFVSFHAYEEKNISVEIQTETQANTRCMVGLENNSISIYTAI